MAFARLFPIDATDTQDGNRTVFETSSLSDGTSYGSPARTDDCGHLLLLPRHDLSKGRGALKAIFGGRRTTDTRTPRAATEAAASSEATALPQFSLKCANFPPKKALHRVDDIGKVAFEEREQ
jgi:hypothetical protein